MGVPLVSWFPLVGNLELEDFFSRGSGRDFPSLRGLEDFFSPKVFDICFMRYSKR